LAARVGSAEGDKEYVINAELPGIKKEAKDRKVRIETGYGLEGTLSDTICKQIITDEIAPRFQAGNFNSGLSAAVSTMIAAIPGEYALNTKRMASFDKGTLATTSPRKTLAHVLEPNSSASKLNTEQGSSSYTSPFVMKPTKPERC
jgi:hypothetical protein